MKPHNFPLYKEEGEFLRAATQPSLNASHSISRPPDTARVLICFKGSAAKLWNFLLYFSLCLMLIRLRRESWFTLFFPSIKSKCNFQNHFSRQRCMKDLPAASKAEIGTFPLLYLRKSMLFSYFKFWPLFCLARCNTLHETTWRSIKY